MTDDSEILDFYKDQTVFLTGATGCLGVLIVDKLLRVCDVKKLHLFVRPKRNKTAEERLDAIFDDVYFDILKVERPDFKKKLHLIQGDCEKADLGMAETDRELLKKEVTCVIHAAANVRFDQSLRMATYNNVRCVKAMLDLAKEMPGLKAYVHVSTAYSNTPYPHIKEEFYDPPMAAEKLFALIDSLDDEKLDKITPKLLGNYFNTYIYTKCIGEDLVRTEGKNLPVALVRPAIIMPAYEGPFPGWINNLYGVIGVTAGVSVGIMRTFCINLKYYCNLVPCDYVANSIMAAAWNVNAAKNRIVENEEKEPVMPARQDDSEIPVYNYSGSNNNLITWDEYIHNLKPLVWKYTSARTLWYIFFITTESLLMYKILTFFLHTIPAYIVDFFLVCFRKKPMAVKIYGKIDKGISLTNPFRLTNWTFDNHNVEKMWKRMRDGDRKLFAFNMETLNWLQYAHKCCAGSRVFLLKDPMDTLERAKKRLVFFGVLHYALVGLIVYGLYKLVMFSFNLVF